MGSKLLVAVAIILVSFSCAAQVQPAGQRFSPQLSAGAGMEFWSGDWGSSDINRWGPTAWGTATVHGLGIIAEGHSMVVGGNQAASKYKLFEGEGGVIYTSGYWGRLQPYFKGEAGFVSLSHPPTGTSHLHFSGNTWAIGGGLEYHTWGKWWTRVDYTYDAIPHFHSPITNQDRTLDPRGFAFGETYRFGASGSRF